MESHLTRLEIRRQALSLAGETTDANLTSRRKHVINAQIDAAAQEVASFADWYCQERKSSWRMDEGDSILSYYDIERAYWLATNYPNDYRPGTYGTTADTWDTNATPIIYPVGPAGVRAVAVWDEDSKGWIEMSRQVLPPVVDMERLDARPSEEQLIATEDGDTAPEIAARVAEKTSERDDARDIPRFYEATHEGIQLFPVPDTGYVIRVKYAVYPTWLSHATTMTESEVDLMPSAVDGLAIIYKTVAMIYAHQKDSVNYEIYERKASNRMRELRGWMNNANEVAFDKTCTFNDAIVVYPRYQQHI